MLEKFNINVFEHRKKYKINLTSKCNMIKKKIYTRKKNLVFTFHKNNRQNILAMQITAFLHSASYKYCAIFNTTVYIAAYSINKYTIQLQSKRYV